MKKNILYSIGASLIIVLMVFNIQFTTNTNNGNFTLSSLMMQAFATGGETGDNSPFCYAGGKNSNACSIDAGIDIAGYGIAGGCSVSCNPGSYACCTLRCTCI